MKTKNAERVGDEVKIGDSFTHFKSVGKSPAIDKRASDFDNTNLRVIKNRRVIESGIDNADIAGYIPGTLDLVFHGIIEKIIIVIIIAC